MKSLTTLKNLWGTLSQNISTANLDLGKQLINDNHRYLLQKYYFNETSFNIQTVANQQAYKFPYNYSILKDLTITVGQLKWVPKVILTRTDWDYVNTLPYTSDIPQYIFIYNGNVEIFPIPSSSGKTITFNYKFRVPDLSIDDYTTGNVDVVNGSATVTGHSTTWATTFKVGNGSVVNQNLWIYFPQPSGDGNWYQVSLIVSNTSITLMQPYQGNTNAGITGYIIGQMPYILEDFHDLLVYRPLEIYFSSINPDNNKYQVYKTLREEGIKMMDNYVGEKVSDVDLGTRPQPINPNLFIYN